MEGDGRKPSAEIWWLWTRRGLWCLEVNGKHVLIPKARIDALVEVE